MCASTLFQRAVPACSIFLFYQPSSAFNEYKPITCTDPDACGDYADGFPAGSGCAPIQKMVENVYKDTSTCACIDIDIVIDSSDVDEPTFFGDRILECDRRCWTCNDQYCIDTIILAQQPTNLGVAKYFRRTSTVVLGGDAHAHPPNAQIILQVSLSLAGFDCTVTLEQDKCQSCEVILVDETTTSPVPVANGEILTQSCYQVDCTNLDGQGMYNSCTGDHQVGSKDVLAYALFDFETSGDDFCLDTDNLDNLPITNLSHREHNQLMVDLSDCALEPYPIPNEDDPRRTRVSFVGCGDGKCTNTDGIEPIILQGQKAALIDFFGPVLLQLDTSGDAVCVAWEEYKSTQIGSSAPKRERSCRQQCVGMGDSSTLFVRSLLQTAATNAAATTYSETSSLRVSVLQLDDDDTGSPAAAGDEESSEAGAASSRLLAIALTSLALTFQANY